jgi:hypothetical protein
VESSRATSFDFPDTTAAAVAEAVRKGLAGWTCYGGINATLFSSRRYNFLVMLV